MRREKNGRPLSRSTREMVVRSWELSPPMLPNWKMSASCRKKMRLSGKNRPNRVRLIWRASALVPEKSVLTVSEAVSDGVSL